MMEYKMLKGNVALAEGALAAGCRYYFGYPITPQNDIPEYLSEKLPKKGGVFIQAESEVASINMLLGASAAGARAMTSSSGPGISLMQEGISYMSGSELPGLIVNITRIGPGLGGIAASQGDYWQATRGGGHGDYRLIVLAPNSVQEMYDLTIKAFELSDKYRNPAMILGDAILGQMKEPVLLSSPPVDIPPRPWSLKGAKGRKAQLIKSLYLGDGEMEEHNWHLFEKYQRLQKEEVLAEINIEENMEIFLVSFGSCSRMVQSAVEMARADGIRAGYVRPITLFPYPYDIIRDISKKAAKVLVVEMNTGQMWDDVRLAIDPGCQAKLLARPGGGIPTPQQIYNEIRLFLKAGDKVAESVY
ncbi:MAG: 3-methyl-2-oxobutanoate dehydrogenase subunit VorB [Dethiobacteria bacterium]|jgi:2-oxoglutarate ferredoxin oxidoreductase subunit alpha